MQPAYKHEGSGEEEERCRCLVYRSRRVGVWRARQVRTEVPVMIGCAALADAEPTHHVYVPLHDRAAEVRAIYAP